MSIKPKYSNKNLIREITLILVIKVIILMMIKNIWFDAPTIPKDFDNHIAEHIAGNPSPIKETR